MVDPPSYRAQPDPEFADRLEQVLLQRLTAPAGSGTRRGGAPRDEPAPSDTGPDDPEADLVVLESDGRPTGGAPTSGRRPGRWLLVAAVASLVAVAGTLIVAARDDEEQVPATTPPPPDAAGVAAFCDAIDDMGLAVSIGEGHEGVDDALIAAEEIAPAEISAEVTTLADESRAQFAAGPPPDGTPPELPPDEFFTALTAVGDYLADHCGFQVIDVTATEHAFEGIPAEAATGKTLIRLTNDGAEYHHLVLQRVHNGETRPIDEILALPEGQDLLDVRSSAFAPPGLGSWTVVDLGTGRYAAMCIIPTGSTSAEALRSGEADPTTPGHDTQGETADLQIT